MKQKIIIGEIADQSGHSEFRGTLEEAVKTIMENCKKHAKWAYVNGSDPFIFEHYDEAEERALYDALNATENPHFTLTPSVEGGHTVVTIVIS